MLTRQEAEHPLYVGIDVGGTSIKIGVIDSAGLTLAYDAIPTDSQLGADAAVIRMAGAVSTLLQEVGAAKQDVARIGLATPGPLDLNTGMLLTPGNLPEWSNYPIRQRVSEACDLPVRYANDANAAAFGEYWKGAGTDCHSMVLLTLGTGVGGGIIVGDMLLEGAHGCGGECGHVVIDLQENAPRDSNDNQGSLEAYCGSYGVVRRVQQALDAGRESQLAERSAITPLAVAQAAEGGDTLAREIVLDTARYLAIGIASLIHTIDPDSVVLGGAMTFGGSGHPLGEEFLQHIRDEVRLRLLHSLRDSVQIDFAQLGSDAGYIGAAGLARLEHLHQTGM
jgi:glucokinase